MKQSKKQKHICGVCTKIFSSEEEYLNHKCEKDLIPTNPAFVNQDEDRKKEKDKLMGLGMNPSEAEKVASEIEYKHLHRYFRKETKKWEEVDPVEWVWEAVYNDNTSLKQYADDGIFHQTDEINLSNLKKLVVSNAPNGKKFIIFYPKGAKLNYQYIGTILSAGTSEEKRLRSFLFSFEAKSGNSYFLITSNGDFITSNNQKDLIV